MSQRDVINFRDLNVREQMHLVEDWLGWQIEDLSFGLHSPADAIKLYEHSLRYSHKLHEMADEWQIGRAHV